MSLLRGQPAMDAAKRILDSADPFACIEVDPDALAGKPITILCIGHSQDTALIDARQTPELGELLASQPLFGAYQAKLTQRALLRTFKAGPERWACAMLVEQLIAGGRREPLELDAIAQKYLTKSMPEADEGFDAIRLRTQGIAQLLQCQIECINEEKLRTVSKIEAQAVAPIAEMEEMGMPLDTAKWRSLTQDAQSKLDEISRHLQNFMTKNAPKDLFGKASINLESHAELKKALNAMGIQVPNTRRDTLRQLPPPLGPWLTRHSELSKVVSTYGNSFLKYATEHNRIHPSFAQIGASTGRMACHSPNLQAIPKDSEHRDCFHSDTGRMMVVADYATCELRILAEMSGDPVFREAFARGDDLHSTVATSLFNKPVSKTQNSDLRHRAKAVNFGLVYGMGAGGLAKTLQVDPQQSRELLNQYFRTFPKIKDFLENQAYQSLERGYSETLSGRRLYLDFDPTDSSARAQAERIAKNMPIQGTSADITKLALALVWKKTRLIPDAYIVNAVHDEIVVECNEGDTEEVARVVQQEMLQAGRTLLKEVPMEVDIEISKIWSK
jgi:DNA polymerase I